MRGADEQPGSMFSYISLEARVPQEHPLRAIRRITDRALERLSPKFGTLYVNFGRPSIAPEKLLRALLIQALYSVRSERQLMEQLDYNALDPLWWTSSERWIRCPAWRKMHWADEPGGSSLRSSRTAPYASSSMTAKRSARWLASWI